MRLTCTVCAGPVLYGTVCLGCGEVHHAACLGPRTQCRACGAKLRLRRIRRAAGAVVGATVAATGAAAASSGPVAGPAAASSGAGLFGDGVSCVCQVLSALPDGEVFVALIGFALVAIVLYGLYRMVRACIEAGLAWAFPGEAPALAPVVAPRKTAPIAPLPPAPQLGDGVRCKVCGDPLTAEQAVLCEECETPHHADCFQYGHGCSTYACQCGEFRAARAS